MQEDPSLLSYLFFSRLFTEDRFSERLWKIQKKTPMSQLSQTLAQVFPYEFWEVFENTFLDRTPLMAASVFIYF